MRVITAVDQYHVIKTDTSSNPWIDVSHHHVVRAPLFGNHCFRMCVVWSTDD